MSSVTSRADNLVARPCYVFHVTGVEGRGKVRDRESEEKGMAW